jgi:hypothetical protein
MKGGNETRRAWTETKEQTVLDGDDATVLTSRCLHDTGKSEKAIDAIH